MHFASFGLLKMVSSNTNTRVLSLVQNAHHPLSILRFIKKLPITATDIVTQPNIAQLLHKSFYMVDFVHSLNTTNEARDSTTQLKFSLGQGDST